MIFLVEEIAARLTISASAAYSDSDDAAAVPF